MISDDDNDGQMIFGEPWGPKASWHLSYRWGKNPKKPHPRNLSRPGIEPFLANVKIMLMYYTSFSGTLYSRGLKILQVIYKSFNCDLTKGFFIHGFNKWIWSFYDDINRGLGSFLSGFLSFSPYYKFYSTISPHSSHPFRFISYQETYDGATGVVDGTLAIHWPWI